MQVVGSDSQHIESLDELAGNAANPSIPLLPIAEDPNSKKTLELARRAAKSKATVLITGETGVGKEVLAHYIHQHSPFSQGPFISVNCAALPENMIEAILFGYERGSFTSAVSHYIGKFEQAQNGSLLLDEISEIPIGLQAKLLRALQEREIERLGGKKVININVRIIAATNRDLYQQVMMGTFRKDLYYRLNVLPVLCIPVRERPLDIIPLAEHFLNVHSQYQERQVPTLSDSAKNKLKEHCWPGNVREIENVMQRALVMTDAHIIDEREILISDEINHEQVYEHSNFQDIQFNSTLEANEARVIIDILKETDGCRNKAANRLNISPRTLRYKLAKLKAIGLEVP